MLLSCSRINATHLYKRTLLWSAVRIFTSLTLCVSRLFGTTPEIHDLSLIFSSRHARLVRTFTLPADDVSNRTFANRFIRSRSLITNLASQEPFTLSWCSGISENVGLIVNTSMVFLSSFNTSLLPTFLRDTARTNPPFEGTHCVNPHGSLLWNHRRVPRAPAIPWRASGDAWVPRVGLYYITKHHARMCRMPYILSCLSLVRYMENSTAMFTGILSRPPAPPRPVDGS